MTDLGPFPDLPGYEDSLSLDSDDALAHHRDRYLHTDPDLIYLDGNSLGRMPTSAPGLVEAVTHDQWGDRLIRSWNEGWWELQLRLGDKLAPIVGANLGEVIISDSTSVNLYKLALSAVQTAEQNRTKIVTDDLNFPSDVYILAGIADQNDMELVVVESDGIHGPTDGLQAAIDDQTALVSLSHTAFKSGYTYDMSPVTKMAHGAGALVLWDCSHSAGALPIDFESADVDLAIGCTYKYLNGGPGSPAFLYVRSSMQERLFNPIAGWWGHTAPFQFDLDFAPVTGIRKFHSGTMPMLSLAAIEPGLDDILDAGMTQIRTKSVALTNYLVELVSLLLEPLGFSVASPREADQRGSHISLAHEMAWPIAKAMIEDANVIPDFRTPDNVRLGLSPLYTSFVDVHTAVGRIAALVEAGVHPRYVDAKATVT